MWFDEKKMVALGASVLLAFVACTRATPLPIPFVNNRIVNGTDADIKDLPFMISLRYNGAHTCGGSIIDEFNVVTAAHCVSNTVSRFSVQYGSTTLSSGGADVIQAEGITIHREFTGLLPGHNDIALVHLVSPLPLGEGVWPVRLPEQYSATPGEAPAVLAGWGLDRTGGSLQNILQKVDIKVFTDDECEWLHRETGPTSRLFHICGGVPEGGKGQCSGDSGGPLVVNGVQVGIVSWSVKPCTVQGYPGVFTKVSTFTDWIEENKKQLLN